MPMYDSKPTQSGFTLVEIAIVMIIIGLLIGGIFGGIKIRENAQVLDIIKQVKIYESSALKFQELYGELPGDMMFPTAKLTNCNAAPCNRAGNGDGIIVGSAVYNVGVTYTTTQIGERFTFWNHLLTAGLISGIRGNDNFAFGQGQPSIDAGGGIIIDGWGGMPNRLNFLFTRVPHPVDSPDNPVLKCQMIANIDLKIDDGMPFRGNLYVVRVGDSCANPALAQSVDNPYFFDSDAGWGLGNVGTFIYATKIAQ